MTKSIRLLLITLSTLNVSYKGIEGVEPVQSIEKLLNYTRGKVLERANDYRTKYGLELLKFNEEMNNEAQVWANYMSNMNSLEHNPQNKSYGENIIQLSEMPNIGARAVDVMYSCIAYVNLNDDESKLYTEENIGTMTQLLWKETTEIGVGVAENSEYQKYYVVIYFNPKGNIDYMFSDNLPKFKQNDIDDGKNELKYFNLGEILISNSEKKIPNYKLENYLDIGTQDEKFNSNEEATGLSHAEASMIRNQVFERSNFYRAKYNLPLFEIKGQMNDVAQKWANYILSVTRLKHNPENKTYGENITIIRSMPNVGEKVVDLWHSCIAYINLYADENQLYTEENIGTVTQLLWKLSTEIGVGVAKHNIRHDYVVVVYFNPKGNEENEFSDNLPKFKQEDIDEGRNELKFFNLNDVLISNSEKEIPLGDIIKYQLINYENIRPREIVLSTTLDEKFNSNRNAKGFNDAEASMIRNEVFERSNFYRAKYNLPLFEIKGQMNNDAQEWANYLVTTMRLQHNPNNQSYGENITFTTIKSNVGNRVVDLWHSCIAYVNVDDDENKLYSEENTGALTQLLWKLSTEIGVGVANHTIRHFRVVVVYFNPKGNERNMFSNNLPKFKQKDINEGKNELRSFNLTRIFISNSEKIIPNHRLKDYESIGTQPVLSRLGNKFDSKWNPIGLSYAEASRIRNQVFIKSNFYRVKYDLCPFEIAEKFNDEAQGRANNLALYGSGIEQEQDLKYGKIEYFTQTTIFGNIGEIAVDEWHNDYKNMTTECNNYRTACLTQLLWFKSVNIGVGVAFSNNDMRYYIVAYFNPKGNIPETCSKNVPIFTQAEIDLAKEAQKEYSELKRFPSVMRSNINKRRSDQVSINTNIASSSNTGSKSFN